MRPATKHYLFFAFLVVSLALLVAVVLWQWHRADAEGAEAGSLNVGGDLCSRPGKPAGLHAAGGASASVLAPAGPTALR